MVSSREPGASARALRRPARRRRRTCGREARPRGAHVLPPFEGHPYGALLGLGSGSVRAATAASSAASPPTGRCRRSGRARPGTALRPAARAHGRAQHRGRRDDGRVPLAAPPGQLEGGSNFVVELSLDQVMSSLRNDLASRPRSSERAPLRPRRHRRGGAHVQRRNADRRPAGRLHASAEADDGHICGSVVGTLRPDGAVERLRTIDRHWKVEGVHAAMDTGVLDFTFVCDQDDPGAPSPLLSATMPLDGRLEYPQAPLTRFRTGLPTSGIAPGCPGKHPGVALSGGGVDHDAGVVGGAEGLSTARTSTGRRSNGRPSSGS